MFHASKLGTCSIRAGYAQPSQNANTARRKGMISMSPIGIESFHIFSTFPKSFLGFNMELEKRFHLSPVLRNDLIINTFEDTSAEIGFTRFHPFCWPIN